MSTIDYVLIFVSVGCVIALILTLLFGRRGGDSKSVEREIRNELTTQLSVTRQELSKSIGDHIDAMTKMNELKLENVRKTVEFGLDKINRDNTEKLEKMRVTVDEKLNDTLERRLGETFKNVNDRLESVYKGLGEMQSLAQGVGDLKKVLTNVKSRGTWGEVQLGNILEQFLTPEQYLTNVKIKKNSNDFVEYAIRIPSKIDGEDVLLPVDSKYPIEDYKRLVDALDAGNVEEIEQCRKQLERQLKVCASQIRDKYIDPPYTTNFGVLFLPTEGLYCEVLRNTSLVETLSKEYKVTITGPTTFTAFINSLWMGFRTLAIEKRTSEVWQVLGNVKSEFEKFGGLLDKTNKKLKEISNTMELATSKTRTIERKLRGVEALPITDEKEYYGMLDIVNPDEDEGKGEDD